MTAPLPDPTLARAQAIQQAIEALRQMPLAQRTIVGPVPLNGAGIASADDDFYGEPDEPSAPPSTIEIPRLDALAPTLGAWLTNPDLLTPPTPLLSHLAWRGRITLYSAPDKGGKSTFATAAVAAASRGDPFLGEGGGTPVRTGWVCLEEAQADLIQRLDQFGADRLNVRVMAFPPDARRDVREFVGLWRPDVLMIDTLVRYARGHVTKSGESAQWAALLDDFIGFARRDNVAPVLLHHAQRRGGEARDSGDITAASDVVIEQRKRHAAGKQHFDVRARWAFRNFGVRLDGTTYRLLTPAEHAAELAPAAQKMLHVLVDKELTATEWLKASRQDDATFYRHRPELCSAGYVMQNGDGRRYRLTDAGTLTLMRLSRDSHESNSLKGRFTLTTLTPHVVGVSESKRERQPQKRRTRRTRKGAA